MSSESDWLLFSRAVPPVWRETAEIVQRMARLGETERALALNLIYDHRISEKRARRFLQFVDERRSSAPLTTFNFPNYLASYRKELVAKAPIDTFGEPPEESVNFVAADHDLIHVCNVSQKLQHITNSGVLNGATSRALQSLRMPGHSLTSAEIDRTLRTRLRDSKKKAEFVPPFLELLREYRKISPWNPVWVAAWEHFQLASDKSVPASWLESVGLQCSPEPVWLLLLRYPSSAVGTLYRPTQLEAGNFAYHFPSPECAQLGRGGHPVHFGVQLPIDGRLVSEFVHQEIDFEVGYWENGGAVLARAAQTAYNSLMGYRRRHYALLCLEYDDAVVREWMPDPVKLVSRPKPTARVHQSGS